MADASLPNLLSWQRLYQAALSETDRGKLTDLVAEVETAIKRRISELSNAKEMDHEWAAMMLAAKRLVRIKSEKLDQHPLKPKSDFGDSRDVLDKIRRIEAIPHRHRWI
jgi:regulator of PEP synthase PpsR (kinase-PPPase family)